MLQTITPLCTHRIQHTCTCGAEQHVPLRVARLDKRASANSATSAVLLAQKLTSVETTRYCRYVCVRCTALTMPIPLCAYATSSSHSVSSASFSSDSWSPTPARQTSSVCWSPSTCLEQFSVSILVLASIVCVAARSALPYIRIAVRSP